MNKWLLLAILILSVAFGTGANAAEAQQGQSGEGPAVRGLNEIIRSPSSDRTQKCHAVFDLFSDHVKLPSTAADLAKVFLERSWIDQAHIRLIEGILGWIPVEWIEGETRYAIYLFYPDQNGRSDCVIYLTLTGVKLHEADLLGLLRGQPNKRDKITSWRAIGISEFALCTQDGECRRFPSAIPEPITPDHAGQIAVAFAARHEIHLQNYDPPAASWFGFSHSIWQVCWALKEERLPLTDLISPGEPFCVQVPLASGRASFGTGTTEEVSVYSLQGVYEGTYQYPSGPFADAKCSLKLLTNFDNLRGYDLHFILKCSDSGSASAGPEFIDGTFALEAPGVVLHGLRRYSAQGEWGDEAQTIIDKTPQALPLRIKNQGASLELVGNFAHEMHLKRIH